MVAAQPWTVAANHLSVQLLVPPPETLPVPVATRRADLRWQRPEQHRLEHARARGGGRGDPDVRLLVDTQPYDQAAGCLHPPPPAKVGRVCTDSVTARTTQWVEIG